MGEKTDAIKTRLQFEGEEEYKTACKAINSSLSVMSSEMRLVTAQYADNSKSVEALTARQQILRKQYDEQTKKVEETQKALAALESQEVKNEEAITAYTIKLNNAKTALTKTGNELNAVDKNLKTAGDASDQFAKEVKEVGEQSEKTGSKLSNLKSVASAVGKGMAAAMKGIATSAVAAAAAISALIMKSIDATGELDDQSQRVGMSAEEFQKYAYAAKLSGLELSNLEGAMTKQQRAFADAKEGNSALIEAYARLGINIDEVGSSADAFDQVIKAIAEMKDETTANALANDLFGKSYADLKPLFNQGAEGIERLKQEAVDLGAVLSNDVVKAGAAAGDSIDRLKTSVTGIANQIGAAFIPVVQSLADEFTGSMKQISDGISAADGDVSKMGEVFGEAISTLFVQIAEKLPDFLKMGVSILSSVIKGIAKNADQLANTAVELVTILIQGIADMMPTLMEAIPQIIIAIVTALAAGSGDIIASAVDIIMALINGLIAAIPQLTAAIPQIIMSIVESLLSGKNNIFNVGVELIKGLWEGIKSMFATLFDNVKNFFSNLWGGIKDFLGIHSPSTEYAYLGKQMAAGIGEGFTDKMQVVTDDIKNSIPTDFNVESNLKVSRTAAETERTPKSAFTRQSGAQASINVTQNIYTPQYNYAEQQRAAVIQLRQIARQV